MANAVYDLARQAFLSQSPVLDWDTDTIRVALVKTAYTFSNAHQYVTDLGANMVVARASCPALGTKTVAAGVAGAANTTFTAPASGNACNVVVFKDSGADATSPLICYIDTGTGLPVTTNGADLNVNWDAGANKIFKL